MSEEIKNKEINANDETNDNAEVSEIEDFKLANASGGGIYHATKKSAVDKNNTWEVVNETGQVEARFGTKGEAKDYCNKRNITKNRILFYSTLLKMQNSWSNKEKYLPEVSNINWRNPHGHGLFS